MKRTTIVHVVGYYPPHKGGMEYAAQAIATEQARMGFRVIVLTSAIGHKVGIEQQNGVTVHYLRSLSFAHTPISPALIKRLYALPQDCVVHLHIAQAFVAESVALVCHKRRIPYVAHLHLDVGASGILGFLLPLYKRLILSRVLRGAQRVIVLNTTFATLVHERYHVSKDKIVVIPNGVDDRFFATSAELKPKISKQPIILCISRLSPQKRVHLLIDAIPMMRTRAKLVVIGGGELESKLKRRAKNNHAVTLLGELDRNAVEQHLRKADIFTLASEREGLPLTLLEAMAAGVPVVASDVIGNHEFVKDDGILVRNASPAAFANAFDKLLASPKRWIMLRARGLRRAKSHRWSRIAKEIITTYEIPASVRGRI